MDIIGVFSRLDTIAEVMKLMKLNGYKTDDRTIPDLFMKNDAWLNHRKQELTVQYQKQKQHRDLSI